MARCGSALAGSRCRCRRWSSRDRTSCPRVPWLAPTHPALYATRSAGKPLVVPADIDHALAYMFSFSCGKKVMEPETLQRGNEWLIGMLEANAVELPAGCNWLESGVVPKDWWERFFKRHPHLEEGKAR